jgi:predicted negative regulator of RcsB-dependent stress response
MKIWKKNLVAFAVLVTVCSGIYVNWLYTQDEMTMSLTETMIDCFRRGE